MITIAISAFFVPHYLSIFWEPLKDNPWDVVVGAAVIALLVGLNIVGIKEAAGLNIFLAVIDFATQLLLVVIGFVLIFSPSILKANVHWGVAPTWKDFFLAIPVAMIAYTGIETVSNLSEEARDPPRDIPRSIRLVAVAVFAIYFTLPFIALSALPVHKVDGNPERFLGLPPEQGGYANDPVLGLVKNLNLQGAFEHGLEIYVGVLAATILLVATNAGVIGASRITYAMASYRQLPEVFRRLHKTFGTPWLALVVFAGFASIAVIVPGQTNFLGTMYAFGAMLSFTIAHASIVALRVKEPDEELVYRARPNLRLGGIDWPLFAILGGFGTAVAWIVVVVQEQATRSWGSAGLQSALSSTCCIAGAFTCRCARQSGGAPAIVLGLEVEYRTILVPVLRTAESEEALVAAARLASERRARIVILHVLEGPLDKAPRRRAPQAERGRRSNPRRGAGAPRNLRGRPDHEPARARPKRGAGDRRGSGPPRCRGRHPRRANQGEGRQADLRAHRGLRAAKRADAGGRRRRQAGRVTAPDGRASPSR